MKRRRDEKQRQLTRRTGELGKERKIERKEREEGM